MAQAEATVLKAGCKVNLWLRITGARPDGYHDLDTLFYPLPEPHDTIHVSEGLAGSGVTLTCDRPGLAGQDNLLVKAARAFQRESGVGADLALHLEKRIPVGAGLGGGSSDAASLLRFLNKEAGDQILSQDDLNSLAASLGADVPFFLQDKPARALSIGEQLTPLQDQAETLLQGLSLVLVCPDLHVSTAWAYSAWDKAQEKILSPRGESLTALLQAGISSVSRCPALLVNDFEPVVFAAYPELRRLKERLLQSGASSALLSGSGASMFALFRDKATAQDAAKGVADTATTYMMML
ncbi:MAG: 4-(cytidine 5'-diphospho)-2-C-methyl-D-erythritol kinase [Desulfovibrio sp.]|nr:MAG: 4-(cytidine 5'-diphospho)-2-C-methyl-D-erythritol kinase [Desulfovibrio sp.]